MDHNLSLLEFELVPIPASVTESSAAQDTWAWGIMQMRYSQVYREQMFADKVARSTF